MEGRWARLTLQAHLQGALDLTKPINPVAEALIFNQIEVKLLMDTMMLGPVVSNNSLYYQSMSSVDNIRDQLLGTTRGHSTKESKYPDLVELYNILNKKDKKE